MATTTKASSAKKPAAATEKKTASAKASTAIKPAKASTKSEASEEENASPASKATGVTGKMEDSEFHEFFVDELKDIYWAEKNLVKALPKLKKAATSPELAAAFDKHTVETKTHIETLEKVFELLGE
ncbi:MAG TPA: DUF892 family protein, partial [Pedobacter sp.]